MRVNVEDDIIQNLNEDDHIALKYLMYMCSYHNRYTLCIDSNLPDDSEMYFTPTEIEFYKNASINAINNSRCDCTISHQGINYNDEPIFTLDEGVRYLMQPVSIILENNKNDALFIETLIRSFNRQVLMDAKKYQWICYANAGGCSNVCNLIEAMLSQYEYKSKFLRCYVILDSDKLAPDHVNPKNSKIELFLNKYNIPYHIWEKRMMENYMPDDAMPNGVLPNGAWKKAYMFLSNDQKDFYNLAAGFERDEKFIPREDDKYDRTCLITEQQTFYSDVSDTNYNILYKGIGMGRFKEEFPKLFYDTTKVYYETLLQRTAHQKNPNELREVLDGIANLL